MVAVIQEDFMEVAAVTRTADEIETVLLRLADHITAVTRRIAALSDPDPQEYPVNRCYDRYLTDRDA